MVDFQKLLDKEREAKRETTFRRNQSARTGSHTNHMRLDPPEKFVTLAQQCIEAADKVPCEMDEYIAGLRWIMSEIEVALQAAKEADGRSIA